MKREKNKIGEKWSCALALCLVAVWVTGCPGIQKIKTGIGQALYHSVAYSFDLGEVYCGDGRVCSEIEVVRVHVDKTVGGRVQVTLHNRTAQSLVPQIGVEILDKNGVLLDKTRFEDVVLPPRQEAVWEMNGLYRFEARLRILLRSRTS